MTSTFTLQLLPCPSGTLVVNATQLGAAAAGATITVSGGPNDFAPITQTANASGQTTFTSLPSGSDAYTISVTDAPGNVTATGSAVIATGATTTANIDLNDPPMGSISALVQWLGANVTGATVTVTGGPYNVTRTADHGRQRHGVVLEQHSCRNRATPSRRPRTVRPRRRPASRSPPARRPRVTLAMPTGTINVTATWLSLAASSRDGLDHGRPERRAPTPGPHGRRHRRDRRCPRRPRAIPYTVTVTKNGGSGTASVTSLTGGGTAAASVIMGGVGTITVNTATWGGTRRQGARTVTITGGPNGGTYTGTTNASGVSGAITVPATTATWPYSVDRDEEHGRPSPAVRSRASPTAATRTRAVAHDADKSVVFTVQKDGVNVGTGLAVDHQHLRRPERDRRRGAVLPVHASRRTRRRRSTVTNLPAATGYTYTVKAYATACAGTTNRSRTRRRPSRPQASTTTFTLNLTQRHLPAHAVAVMSMRLRLQRLRRDERGFTLVELHGDDGDPRDRRRRLRRRFSRRRSPRARTSRSSPRSRPRRARRSSSSPVTFARRTRVSTAAGRSRRSAARRSRSSRRSALDAVQAPARPVAAERHELPAAVRHDLGYRRRSVGLADGDHERRPGIPGRARSATRRPRSSRGSRTTGRRSRRSPPTFGS